MISFIQVVLFNLRHLFHYPRLNLSNISMDRTMPIAGDGVVRVNGREYARITNENASDFGWDIEAASKQIVRRRDGPLEYRCDRAY